MSQVTDPRARHRARWSARRGHRRPRAATSATRPSSPPGSPTTTAGSATSARTRSSPASTGCGSTPAPTSPTTRYDRRSIPEVVVTSRSTRRRALPRAAPAQPLRLLDLPGQLMAADGASSWAEPVRQGREPAGPGRPRHAASRDPRPQRIDRACAATSPTAHTDGDQAQVLPTDTQKNTVFAFAKTARRRPDRGLRPRPRAALRRRRRARDRGPGRDRGVRLGPDRRRRRWPRPQLRPARARRSARPPSRSRARRRAADVGRLRGSRTSSCSSRPARSSPASCSDDYTTLRGDPRPGDGHLAHRPLALRRLSARLADVVRRDPADPARAVRRPCTAWRCSRRCTRWAGRSSSSNRRSPRSGSPRRTSTTSSTT